jgi:hypothetical protein
MMLPVWGQDQALKPRDTANLGWRPHLIRPGLDISRPLATMVTDYRSSAEVSFEIGLNRYFLIAEAGTENNDRVEDYQYQSRGNYYRLGFDYNITPYNAFKNVVSFGLRYAQADFSDEILMVYDNAPFQPIEVLRKNEELKARWLEGTFNLKVRVWENLFMGYIIRLKFAKKVNGQVDELQPYDLPGFGRNDRTFTLGLNYSISWSIPLE